jgi:DNA-binding transcriptional LysR family regulator
LALIVPQAHSLASRHSIGFDEIGQECEFLMFPPKSSLRRLVDQVAKWPLRQALEIDSFDSMCHMVAAGAGIGVLPKASAAPYLGKGVVAVSLDDAWAKRELRIAIRSMESLTG